MKMAWKHAGVIALLLVVLGSDRTAMAQPAPRHAASAQTAATKRAEGPCDVYAAAGDPCVAAHSTTRALYAAYNGPLYQVLRQSDGARLNIGIVRPTANDGGGYANAAAQDAFCANTHCFISTVYDQSGKGNHLYQAPRGAFSGPSLGGLNNLPIADMAPVSVMGHKVYGVFILPGSGLRQNDAKGTAVDDQAEGQYWVINGRHYNSGCCFDYGNAEIDSRDDNNGTMETTYYGSAMSWYHGNPPGPWVMTDQENNLVGCVNQNTTSKLCTDLPNVNWRFVTAMAKGEPHHWTSMGGDAQSGALQVMFDGPRVDRSYDPMRKQGAILLGNGGDNSVGSQGTFYEGAMTAAGTFPTDATDQKVQANVVAAHYAEAAVSIAPTAAVEAPTGLQTFALGSTRETAVLFHADAPAFGIRISLSVPKGWTVEGGSSRTVADQPVKGIANSSFRITSSKTPFNGDIIATATWSDSNGKHVQTATEKVRNVSPIKINEFRVGTAAPTNSTNSFIELYNAGSTPVDLSNWTLTQHAATVPVTSAVKIPAGKQLAPGAFYVLGLAPSGLAASSMPGASTIYVRSAADIQPGDTITIDAGASAETRTVKQAGSASSAGTTLWQPVPNKNVVLNFPIGSKHLPVFSTADFHVGDRVAIGHGADFPATARDTEKFEVVTITEVGKPGTQAFLATDAAPGDTNIKVTNVANITAGDRIRLDIDSMGHGIETVTVKNVGTQAVRTSIAGHIDAGVSTLRIRSANGLAAGDSVIIGTPANQRSYTIGSITAGETRGPFGGASITVTPAIVDSHDSGEDVVKPGTGLELAQPLKFKHAANLPFAADGTGITFTPATRFAHVSDEPVIPLGTGLSLDKPLTKNHATDAVVADAKVTTAGYQGSHQPDQWFGGPALSPAAGNMVLRDAAGMVVDSLNYGLIVDPYTGEGYQGESGMFKPGCRVVPPLAAAGAGVSAGRFPDGNDTDSNCGDFVAQPVTSLAAAAKAGSTNIKVAAVTSLSAGQPLHLGSGSEEETVRVAEVGTPGASTIDAAAPAGATTIHVTSVVGFTANQAVIIGEGSHAETTVITAANRFGSTLTLSKPLSSAYSAGTAVTGTGLTLAAPLQRSHAASSSVAGDAATPGSANMYFKK